MVVMRCDSLVSAHYFLHTLKKALISLEFDLIFV